MITAAVRDIFRANLGVKKTEKCLVFTDIPSSEENIGPEEAERRARLKCIAFLTAEVGKGLVGKMVFHEYTATGSHGAEPPVGLWEAAFGQKAVSGLEKKGLLSPILQKRASDEDVRNAEAVIRKFRKDAVDAVIALANYSTSHTRFRDLLTRVCGARYASMPLFELPMFEGPMDVDWRHLAGLTKKVAARINRAVAVEITTGNGSCLTFSIKGRKAASDTGILTKPGSFGNLPAGEAFLAPVEGTSKGELILEWAPTRELKSPVTLIVKDGLVKDVIGNEEFVEQLRGKLAERVENSNIAELGIGTNSRAKRPDNILESEKIMGTIHIALGDNSSFGGNVKTPFHQDFVFFRPTVVLIHKDGSKSFLMKKGKFVPD